MEVSMGRKHAIYDFEDFSGPLQVWSSSTTFKVHRCAGEVGTKNEHPYGASILSPGQRPKKAELTLKQHHAHLWCLDSSKDVIIGYPAPVRRGNAQHIYI